MLCAVECPTHAPCMGECTQEVKLMIPILLWYHKLGVHSEEDYPFIIHSQLKAVKIEQRKQVEK